MKHINILLTFFLCLSSLTCYRSSDYGNHRDAREDADVSETPEELDLDNDDECVFPCNGRECGIDPLCGTYCGDCESDQACTEDGRCTRCTQPYCEEVFIPEGPFVMGCDPSPVYGACSDFSQPKHVCYLSSYYIDKYEVTIERYMACVEVGVCSFPHVEQREEFEYYFGDEYLHHPVVLVTWDDAKTYCEWTGRDLPTEAQWGKAARGGCEIVPPESCGPEDERKYPWGDDDPTCELAFFTDNWDTLNPECGGERIYNPDRVDARPMGASPYGIMGMAANVEEYCNDGMEPDYYSKCVVECIDPQDVNDSFLKSMRGQDFRTSNIPSLCIANRGCYNYEYPEHSYVFYGFRCARIPATVSVNPVCSAE